MSNAYVGDYDGPNPTAIDWNPGGLSGLARFGNDQSTIVFFHKHAVPNEQKSIAAGRRISDDVIFVSYQHPGEREQKGDRPMQEADKYRWPRQWQQFLKREEQTVDGTPIDLLFPNFPSIADNLRSAGITVVEQLANLSDTGIHNVGLGARDYVNYARAYLEHAQKGVGFHQMQKELADRDQKIKIQEQRIDLLTQQLDQLLKQNAAIIGAIPDIRHVPMTNFAAPAQTQKEFSLPPLPTKIPEEKSDKAEAARARMAVARAAKIAKKAALDEILTADHDERDPLDAEELVDNGTD